MNKAGVGSAVNDTTREVGGAIGIAVVGSIVTSVYRSHVANALKVLPPDLATIAGRNAGAAIEVAGRLPDPTASASFAKAVRQSFVDGMHLGLRVSAALAVVAGVAVVARLPHREAPGGRTATG
jgi:DHA2 family multidrug resistance protein-like MFS transporter